MQRQWQRIEHQSAPLGHALQARTGGVTWTTWQRYDGRWIVDRDGRRVAVVGSLKDVRSHVEGRMPEKNPNTKANELIRLSNGDVMTLSEAIDSGRVELREGISGKTGKPSYDAWEAPDFDVGWQVSKTLYESRMGMPISAAKGSKRNPSKFKRVQMSTGNYDLTTYEKKDPHGNRIGVIEIVYTGDWGSGESVVLEYYLEEEHEEAEQFEQDREAKGDYDVREILLRHGYDEYTNRIRNPKTRRPRTMARNQSKFVLGDLVRYTAKFQRSIGQYASNRINGIVVGESSLGPYVVWNDETPSVPRPINAANIEHDPRLDPNQTKDERLALARLGADGLPVGKARRGGPVIYSYERPRHKWTALRIFPANEQDAHKSAETYYDEHGERAHVVVLDKNGFVTMSLPARFGKLAGEKNPRKKKISQHGAGEITGSDAREILRSGKHVWKVMYLPFADTPLIRPTTRGYGYGRYEEFYASRQEAKLRYEELKASGYVEDIELRDFRAPYLSANTLLEEWKVGEKNPRTRNTKRPTFAQARDAVFAALERDGWLVKRSLKVPKAEKTIAGNRVILHFRPQAVWLEVKDMAPVRSTHVDIRDVEPSAWVATLPKEAKDSIDLEAEFRNPNPKKGGKKRTKVTTTTTTKTTRVVQQTRSRNVVDRRYAPYTDKLNPKFVQSKQGYMADDLDLVKQYARARADHHCTTQVISQVRGEQMWFVETAGKPQAANAVFVSRVHPTVAQCGPPKGNPNRVALPKDAIYFVRFDDGRGTTRKVTHVDASKIVASGSGHPYPYKGKTVLLVGVLPSAYRGVWQSSRHFALPLWDWSRGRMTCPQIEAWIEAAFREEAHRSEKSRAYHAFQELKALLCGPSVSSR